LDVNYDRFAKYFGELVCHPTVCKECQADVAPVQTPTTSSTAAASSSTTTANPSPKPPPPKSASSSTAPPPPPPKPTKTPGLVQTPAKTPSRPTKDSLNSPKKHTPAPKPQSTFGKWTTSFSLSVAATRAMFSDRGTTDDSDALSKKKTRRGDIAATALAEKENTSPTDEDESTGDTSVCEKYAELSLSDSVGPVRKKSQHWHDVITNMAASQDILVDV